jgi:hypothetical protein
MLADSIITLALMFYTTLFFTVLFLVAPGKGFQLFFGGLTTVCWFILALVFLASGAAFPPLALLFAALGLSFIGFDIYLGFYKPEESDIE